MEIIDAIFSLITMIISLAVFVIYWLVIGGLLYLGYLGVIYILNAIPA